MKNNKECTELAEKIRNLKNEISEREEPSNEGLKLFVPLSDKITEENSERLHELKEKYKLHCG